MSLFLRILPLAEITFLTPPPRMTGAAEVLSQPPSQLVLLLIGLVVIGVVILFFALLRPARVAVADPGDAPHWIIIDGSNVMHWKDETPQIASVQAVIKELKRRGFSPGVVFDANAGYKLSDRYMNERDFAKLLGLREDRVFVVPKGTQADPYLLSAARDLGARIVTRDRFRDWADAHPEVKTAGFLIRGGYRSSGEFWLDEAWPKVAEPAA